MHPGQPKINPERHNRIKTRIFGYKQFQNKKNIQKFRGFGSTIEENINATINPRTTKKQKMIPQTVHMLAYKNVIANGLKTIQKLPFEYVKQFNEMIKQNNNFMNNNLWFLFKQLVFQIVKIQKKKTDAVIRQWEKHFDKLQYGQSLDEDNPNVTKNSKNENCSKKIQQNNIGSSHDKSYNKYKTQLLDKCGNDTIKKMRDIPKCINKHNAEKMQNIPKHVI